LGQGALSKEPTWFLYLDFLWVERLLSFTHFFFVFNGVREPLLAVSVFLLDVFETILFQRSVLPLNSKKSLSVVILVGFPSFTIVAEPWFIQYSSNHSSPNLLKIPFSFFRSSMSKIEPIFAVFPEPCLSLAIFHFSSAKKSKSLTTEVIDFKFLTVVTEHSPTFLVGISYSS